MPVHPWEISKRYPTTLVLPAFTYLTKNYVWSTFKEDCNDTVSSMRKRGPPGVVRFVYQCNVDSPLSSSETSAFTKILQRSFPSTAATQVPLSRFTAER